METPHPDPSGTLLYCGFTTWGTPTHLFPYKGLCTTLSSLGPSTRYNPFRELLFHSLILRDLLPGPVPSGIPRTLALLLRDTIQGPLTPFCPLRCPPYLHLIIHRPLIPFFPLETLSECTSPRTPPRNTHTQCNYSGTLTLSPLPRGTALTQSITRGPLTMSCPLKDPSSCPLLPWTPPSPNLRLGLLRHPHPVLSS